MKRLLAILLVMGLLCLCACSDSASRLETEAPEKTTETSEETTETTMPETDISSESTEQTCTPILYKVTAENGATLYLFGSIHATDSRAYPLPDYVMQAYDESDYLAVECDINAFADDFAAQTDMTMKMVLTDGTTISDHIGQEIYNDAKELLSEHDLYFSVFDSYAPAMWMSLMESAVMEISGLDSESAIDMFFLKRAASEEKEIREVESVEFQYDLLLSFSDELMADIIASYTENPQASADGTVMLYEAWLAGDEQALIALLDEEIPQEKAELYADYQVKLFTERNLSMADTAESYLAQGGTGFFVVGAGHILGEDGCANLLTARGYRVERVS